MGVASTHLVLGATTFLAPDPPAATLWQVLTASSLPIYVFDHPEQVAKKGISNSSEGVLSWYKHPQVFGLSTHDQHIKSLLWDAHKTILREIQQIRFEGFAVGFEMLHIADLTSRYH